MFWDLQINSAALAAFAFYMHVAVREQKKNESVAGEGNSMRFNAAKRTITGTKSAGYVGYPAGCTGETRVASGKIKWAEKAGGRVFYERKWRWGE